MKNTKFTKTLLTAAVSLTAALTACANQRQPQEDGLQGNSSRGDMTSSVDVGDAVEPIIRGERASADFSGLSTQKNGYGQGVITDDENRPQGALDFNLKYSKYNACAIGEKEDKLTLTFDQGYENGYTAKILDTLKEKNVRAVFFVLQDYAEKNPDLVKRMIDEGHTVGNHSVTHRSMPELSAEECKEEIMGLHQYMKENFNYDMKLFRPPMGEYSELSLAVTSECGYRTVLWSFAYADWDVQAQPDPNTALEKLTNALRADTRRFYRLRKSRGIRVQLNRRAVFIS